MRNGAAAPTPAPAMDTGHAGHMGNRAEEARTQPPPPPPPEHTLRILQYNVHHSIDLVMAALLRDDKMLDYMVVAVQEPWVCQQADTTHYPPEFRAHFDLIWPTIPRPAVPRVCTFVRRALTWKLVFYTKDVITIFIQPDESHGGLFIHNVYNEPTRRKPTAETKQWSILTSTITRHTRNLQRLLICQTCSVTFPPRVRITQQFISGKVTRSAWQSKKVVSET